MYTKETVENMDDEKFLEEVKELYLSDLDYDSATGEITIATAGDGNGEYQRALLARMLENMSEATFSRYHTLVCIAKTSEVLVEEVLQRFGEMVVEMTEPTWESLNETNPEIHPDQLSSDQLLQALSQTHPIDIYCEVYGNNELSSDAGDVPEIIDNFKEKCPELQVEALTNATRLRVLSMSALDDFITEWVNSYPKPTVH